MPKPFSPCRRLAVASLLVAVCSTTASLAADPPQDLRSMASVLVGRWSGEGLYDGNRLGFTRRWSFDLEESVVRVEMEVSMPNGVSFDSMAYWNPAGDGPYDVFWMDQMGRFELLKAEVDAATGEVSIEFVDDHAEGGPASRRWVYRIIDEKHYVERLFGRSGEEWKQLAEFSLHRQGS